MIKLTTSLYAEMNEVLGEIAITSENTLQSSERSYHVIQAMLQRIKEYIIDYSFKDLEEEILFFKEIKPQFLGELIYHMKLFHIEAKKPVGNSENQIAYYKKATEKINAFFDQNQSFYIYYRMGKSDHDSNYFIRKADRNELLPEYSLDIDPRFTTIHSYKLAKMLAYERLNEYLQQMTYELSNPDIAIFAGENKKRKNLWTDTKAALIELAYAIHSRGAVNHGKGDVKQIITDLELIFNVQVGNFYRTFQSMRIRKKNRTPFLDGCKDSLERRMDATDLNYQ